MILVTFNYKNLTIAGSDGLHLNFANHDQAEISKESKAILTGERNCLIDTEEPNKCKT